MLIRLLVLVVIMLSMLISSRVMWLSMVFLVWLVGRGIEWLVSMF